MKGISAKDLTIPICSNCGARIRFKESNLCVDCAEKLITKAKEADAPEEEGFNGFPGPKQWRGR
jgi:DNA-directed RNA polymerase subunit RPC12/RpoP